MSSKNDNLMMQLRGLRLSDGATAGVRVSNTPPSLAALSSRATPTAGSPTGFPAATVTSESLESRHGVTGGSGGGSQRRGHRAARPEKESEAASGITEKINRLLAQNQGSLANMSPTTATAAPATSIETKSNDNGNSIISSLAAHYSKATPPPSGSGAASAASFSAASTPPATAATSTASTPAAAASSGVSAAARNGLLVPKPRSTGATVPPTAAAAGASGAAAAATTTSISSPTSGAEALNPKVMEFFNTVANTTRSPPPLADSAAVLKVAVAVTEPTAQKSAHPTRASPSSTAAAAAASSPATTRNAPRSSAAAAAATTAPAKAAAREAPEPANRFLSDAFGNIDNLDATRAFIRTAPQIAADGRYIIVGDLHGCLEQLEQLMEKVKYVKGKDSLFIIGDYVNKGPDSIGVVRACQRLGAYGVLGNHDYTLLRCCARMRRRPFTPEDLRDPVKRLAQKFPKDCEYYLRGLPHMVRIPRHNVLLVHAGLNLEHTLEEQNVEEIMHLRRLEAQASKPGTYRAVVKGMDGEPWGALWKGPEMVIFGHDAYSGFQSHPFACGIDTGCVYGDPLTCVVYGPDSPSGDFFSVPGLPKLENEMKGLPPPNSDIYEQHETNLERLIIRPTSRATPAMMNGSISSRPVFLAAPLGYGEGTDAGGAASAAFTAPAAAMTSTPVSSGAKLTGLTATVTSTNAIMTPTSGFPSRLATPTCPTNVRLLETTTVNTREVQRSTLLALSATRELSAISVLLAMPLYSTEIDAMLGAEAKDAVAQEAFWTPFTQLVLVAATNASGRSAAEVAAMEGSVQLALDVCQEMEAIGTRLQAELAKFVETAQESQTWPKRIVKYAETLVE